VTTTFPSAEGKTTGLPFNVARRFHGAPIRIQRRFPEKRAVCPACNVLS
jgi:hypothetical protein